MSYQDITPAELDARRDQVRLIDVRSAAETAQGIIEGAEVIPLHLVPMQVDDFKDSRDVVLYCHSGARSAQACQFLAGQGLNNLYNLQGGILHWAGQGLPLVRPQA